MSALSHSGHDYRLLLGLWEETCLASGLHCEAICKVGELPVLKVENAFAAAGVPGGLYVSAGVHGDECAPVWALLEWVTSAPSILRECPVTIFPCLNPVGLIENTRRDGSGIDLNRSFADASQPVIAAWQQALVGRRFDVSVNLHEDYDATGIYLYELTRRESRGDQLLLACETHLHRDSAIVIDGSDFENGLLVRTTEIEQVVEEQLGGGYPEAILLFLKYAEMSYTFETPSESDLLLRIAAHRAFLEAVAEAQA
ncbi:MAG: M14 family metallocarboxypeptidase [Verrucomicrobiales bacterium]|nr:M14 family metallocarboxypeptidase [Verrucomicrobiales bacterium]